NQRNVAAAAEQLGVGNPVYESVLLSDSVATARQGLQQLPAEIYPATGAMLLNDSLQLRDAVGERLRHVPVSGERNLWLKALGAWGKTDSRSETAGSTRSLGGLLAGVDGELDEQTRVGVVAGYSDSSLNMGSGTHASASIDSYHFGAYAGRELGDWRVSVGGAYSWHRGDVKRDLQYGAVSGKQKAKLEARTAQLFTEAAYRIHLQPLALEPFANLAYVHLDTDGFTEKGDAAALKGRDDSRDVVLSTLGARALKTINLNDHQALEVSGTLGWQHNLSRVGSEQSLAFASGGPSFAVQSAPLVRDAALVGARVSLALTKDARVNFDYNGLLASKENVHGVGLSLDWAF
ncbi:autotransporter domain-containing protein, partial [Corynebacterium pseudodiphtheriticum]